MTTPNEIILIAHEPKPRQDFQIIRVGLTHASVCAALPREQIAERMNSEHPAGTENGWSIADEAFRTGETNPCQCPDHPTTHQHWLLVC